jgi:hypothetical protein
MGITILGCAVRCAVSEIEITVSNEYPYNNSFISGKRVERMFFRYFCCVVAWLGPLDPSSTDPHKTVIGSRKKYQNRQKCPWMVDASCKKCRRL